MSQFILSGFADEIDSDLITQLEGIKSLNIGYIEIRGVNGKSVTQYSMEEIREFKGILDDYGIGVSAIGSPIGKITMEEDYESHLELFKHTIAIAQTLETKYIRLFSFYMEKEDIQRYEETVINRLKEMTYYAAQRDIVLLHENEKGIYGDEPERCLKLVQTIDSPHFRLIFDPANFVQCQVETYPRAYELLADYIDYMHIKDAVMETGQVVVAGAGQGHLPEILQALQQRSYRGFLSLEPHLGDFDGFKTLEKEGEEALTKEKSGLKVFAHATEALRNQLRTTGIKEDLWK